MHGVVRTCLMISSRETSILATPPSAAPMVNPPMARDARDIFFTNSTCRVRGQIWRLESYEVPNLRGVHFGVVGADIHSVWPRVCASI